MYVVFWIETLSRESLEKILTTKIKIFFHYKAHYGGLYNKTFLFLK